MVLLAFVDANPINSQSTTIKENMSPYTRARQQLWVAIPSRFAVLLRLTISSRLEGR